MSLPACPSLGGTPPEGQRDPGSNATLDRQGYVQVSRPSRPWGIVGDRFEVWDL
jgi:hypothetical protein